jgi:hypothetical protein
MHARFKEPSTYAGVGLLLVALDKIFDINEAAVVGSDIASAASSGAPLGTIVSVGLASLLSIFLSEGKK